MSRKLSTSGATLAAAPIEVARVSTPSARRITAQTRRLSGHTNAVKRPIQVISAGVAPEMNPDAWARAPPAQPARRSAANHGGSRALRLDGPGAEVGKS